MTAALHANHICEFENTVQLAIKSTCKTNTFPHMLPQLKRRNSAVNETVMAHGAVYFMGVHVYLTERGVI